MATNPLSCLLQQCFDGLGSLIKNEFGLIKDLEKDIENLRSNMSATMAGVGDAEKKQLKNKALKDWLVKLKHAAYDADDIFDEFESEASRRELESPDSLIRKMCNYLSVSTSNPLLFRSCIARKVKDVKERLSAIEKEQSKFHLIAGDKEISDTEVMRKTDSWVIESEVSGRDEEKRSLVEALLNVGREEELSVIPIVGMGGIGKTTLAQIVYNDARVMAHFDVRIWVCVSDDFDVKRVMKAIMDSPDIENCNSEELDPLQCHLRQQLRGRKFLLVLDDVWEEQPSKWDQLSRYLQSGVAGSKIIVTTRSAKVSLLMGRGTLPSCQLSKLSDDDCWKLFKQRAFRPGQEENPNLVALGKEIVKMCGGVPLAAKALGSMMLFRTSEREWEVIKDDEIWNSPEEENGILPALRLSYYNLSPQLKQCFAYCSIFPKDREIDTRELILMWMGEGFIQPTQGRQEMEDTGRELFKSLLWRSFFQEPKEDEEGNIVSCKMHDLMHDLAVSISREVCSIVKDGDATSIPSGCRHLSFVSIMIPTHLNRVEKVRTLLTFGPRLRRTSEDPSFDISIRLPHLRVLKLFFSFSGKEDFEAFLNSVSGLKQLRYLCLESGWIPSVSILPESWCKLHNLQTLRLLDCRELIELPRDMRRMTSLRHLEIHDRQLTRMPPKMGELKFLQTLPVFIVGDEESGCNIRELQELNLGGKLQLRKLENVRGRENAAEAGLNEKANLRSLIFSWSDDDSTRSISGHTIEGLQPHKNLKQLEVEGYWGERCPHWMSNPLVLQNLTSLSLRNCKRCKELPSLGQLPLLKSLYVDGMNAVKCIGTHFYGERAFPSLEELSFVGMSNLEEWSSSAELNHRQPQAFPRLQKLKICACLKLTAIPTCFPSLSSLDLQMFQVDSLPVGLFQNKTRLSTVTLHCEKLKSLPRNLGNLDALHTLEIFRCDDLTSLRLEGGFTSLQNLTISHCFSLESFVGDTHDLTSPKSLDIESCPQLGSVPEGTKHLTALRSLRIEDCPRVVCLPECLKHARMLEDLRISDLQNFAHLPEWIQNFSSLQELKILFCENLVALPSGLQHITNLKCLTIVRCPQLDKRCKEREGEDWNKIAHIPDRTIIRMESDVIFRYDSQVSVISIRMMGNWILASTHPRHQDWMQVYKRN